jgi:hypothetical protein
MAKKIFKVIKKDTILKVDISGAYYKRVYELMIAILDKQPDMKQCIINIDNPDAELSLSEATIQTLMMLVKSIEAEANKEPELYIDNVELEIDDTTPSES